MPCLVDTSGEACPFLTGNGGRVDMRERGGGGEEMGREGKENHSWDVRNERRINKEKYIHN